MAIFTWRGLNGPWRCGGVAVVLASSLADARELLNDPRACAIAADDNPDLWPFLHEWVGAAAAKVDPDSVIGLGMDADVDPQIVVVSRGSEC